MSNNCIQTGGNEGGKPWNILTGGHRRTAYALELELSYLCTKAGLENLGFLTLTVADHKHPLIQSIQKRYRSLRTNVLADRYPQSVWVAERGAKRGRWHLHGVVVVGKDIRTGFDFAAAEKGNYASANDILRDEWSFWRETAPKYGFGRTELLPIKSNADGIARYVGKYIGKHIGQRLESDKGVRTIRFVGFGPGERRASSRLGWANDNGWLWRAKCRAWAAANGLDETTVAEECGPRWAYVFGDAIIGTPLPAGTLYPSLAIGLADEEAMRNRRAQREEALRVHPTRPATRTVLLATPTCART